MGTRAKPGEYDCYNSLKPDEPYFLLKGSSPLSPVIVRVWAMMQRLRNGSAATAVDQAKLDEAEKCAKAMEKWRAKNVPAA